MALQLSEKQIKLFVEKYGDGDVYFSHEYLEDGTIKVKYFPVLRKFVSDESIPYLFVELQETPHLLPKYARDLYLTDTYAYVMFDGEVVKNKLTKNYRQFLQDVKDNKLVYPRDLETLQQQMKQKQNRQNNSKYSNKHHFDSHKNNNNNTQTPKQPENTSSSKLFDFSRNGK